MPSWMVSIIRSSTVDSDEFNLNSACDVDVENDRAFANRSNAVKFDTAKLPPILNALETTNNNQKLVLEVSVSDHYLTTNN